MRYQHERSEQVVRWSSSNKQRPEQQRDGAVIKAAAQQVMKPPEVQRVHGYRQIGLKRKTITADRQAPPGSGTRTCSCIPAGPTTVTASPPPSLDPAMRSPPPTHAL